MKIIFIIIFLGIYIYADSSLVDVQKKTIENAIKKLKNDKYIIKEFYFIGKMQCYINAKVGNPRYIKTALDMQMNTYFRTPYQFLSRNDIENYFKKIYTKDALYNKREDLAKNQELYKNKMRPEYWTGYYVCENLNLITEENKLKYQEFIEVSKKKLKYSSSLYNIALAYLNNKNYYNYDKIDAIKKQDMSNSKYLISKLTNKPYIAEASAIRGSMMLNNLKIDVPKQYWDDIGRIKNMKDKPIIATAKKFKKFMDKHFEGKRINIETNTTCKINYLQQQFGKEKGLYIFIPKDSKAFKLTGYITIWDGNISKNGRQYYQNIDGKATLYIPK